MKKTQSNIEAIATTKVKVEKKNSKSAKKEKVVAETEVKTEVAKTPEVKTEVAETPEAKKKITKRKRVAKKLFGVYKKEDGMIIDKVKSASLDLAKKNVKSKYGINFYNLTVKKYVFE